ncbi:acetate/propionate family kinase [Candidatus Saccharibacteria bacterium]|nr:acetate/propionate family kinase [Candidatus Saccharibacteria bacterium]MBQ9016714.1 acetate/propionate family kinase [Candidatus Saccharibacteria bacterium]
MDKNKLILITNPGSSSRKYALYKGTDLVCSLHFEFEGKEIICTLKKADGSKKVLKQTFKELTSTVANINRILTEEGYLGGMSKIDAILARVACPGEYFTEDHIVDEEYLKALEKGKKRAPLHVPVVAGEIEHFVKSFKDTPILAISDTSFHTDRPDLMKYYGFDTEIADKADIKKFGYHGLSIGSIVNYMKEQDILPEKLIVCHLGSGSSLTAVFEGKSLDTTMGYSPIGGLLMATRCGDMDPAAALALKRHLGYESDESIEKYLNKECGLLGVSGQSDDMREILRLRDEGDKRGTFAHAMYVYRVQSCIGQMAASLGGVDAIVFTATIGERSDEIRRTVTQKLSYLGFSLDDEKNLGDLDERHVNIAADGSKPIWVIRTDEFEEMLRRAALLLEK